MANIRPFDLPPAPNVPSSAAFVIDTGAVVQKATAEQIVDSAIPLASQAQAETGSGNDTRMSPLRVQQAINAQALSQDFLSGPDGASEVGFIEPATGALAENAQDALRRMALSPLSFGCAGDGATDDTVGLREAVNAALALGRPLDLSNATYLIRRQGAEIEGRPIIPIDGANITILGDRNNNIKIADDCGNYRAIFGPTSVFDIQNWRFEKIGFDKNSIANEIATGITAQGRYSITTYTGGAVVGKVVVTECDFIRSDAVVDVYLPEVSTGAVPVDRPTNRWISVTNNRWVACRVGGPVALFYDQSLINIAGDGALVTGNSFVGESWERCPATAIETHSDYTIISGNTGAMVCTAINATMGLRHSAPFSRSVSVSNNEFEVCRVGIYLWPERMTTTPDDGRVAGSGLSAVNNTIHHRWPKYPYADTPRLWGIGFYAGGARTLDVADVTISGNTIIYDDPEGVDAFDRPNNVGTDASIGFYAGGAQDWAVFGLTVSGNTVKNAPCPAYKLEYGNVTDFVFTGNNAVDCARTDSPSVSGINRSIYLFSTTFVNSPVIEGNRASVSPTLTTKPVNFLYVRDRGAVPPMITLRANDLDDVGATVKYLEDFAGITVKIDGGTIPSPTSPLSTRPAVGSWLSCADQSQAQRRVKINPAFWSLEAWLSAAPVSGTWPTQSRAHNISVAVLGTPPNQYVIDGWTCTNGPSNIWVERRSLTGT